MVAIGLVNLFIATKCSQMSFLSLIKDSFIKIDISETYDGGVLLAIDRVRIGITQLFLSCFLIVVVSIHKINNRRYQRILSYLNEKT